MIEGVTEGLARALPFMSSLVEQNLSANEIIRRTTAAGFSMRRTAALSVIRQFKEVATGANYIKAVRDEFLPNPERIAYSVTDIRRNYSYKVRMDGRDSLTGERTQFFVQVTSDQLMTKSEAYAQAMDFLSQNAENYTFEFQAATVVQAVKSPRLASRL